MIQNDGEYIIYIIQFKYVDSKDQDWHNAGSCDQFMKKQLNRKEWERIRFKTPFKNLSACGDCWQRTGVHGTYNLEDATYALIKVSEWNPGREFRVAKVEINQETTQIATMKL